MKLSGIWYHGSNIAFVNFSYPKRYSPSEQLGFGIHFAKEKSFAELYGNIIYKCNLYPVKVLDISQGMLVTPGTPIDKLARDFILRGHHPYFIDGEHYVFGNGIIDARSPKDAERILKKYGYDAVVYNARYGTRVIHGGGYGMAVEHESIAVTILDPSKIEIIEVSPISARKIMRPINMSIRKKIGVKK